MDGISGGQQRHKRRRKVREELISLLFCFSYAFLSLASLAHVKDREWHGRRYSLLGGMDLPKKYRRVIVVVGLEWKKKFREAEKQCKNGREAVSVGPPTATRDERPQQLFRMPSARDQIGKDGSALLS
ncbi:unnamed protein product [Dovyalis caffra]|uniref:Uncharacterized protein n=1 Tax=Dovyalis caffra TaxID=77055 RepID=A0AAV1S7S9_9ROSI|nr:unnamed protein product [Dovyalis caffra]